MVKRSKQKWDYWQWLKIILIVVAILGVLTLFRVILSPLFKMLNTMFDGLDAVASTLQTWVGSCTKNGWFSSKCGLGIAAMIAGSLWLLVSIVRIATAWRQKNQSEMVEKAAFETGKTSAELADDMAKEFVDQKDEIDRVLDEKYPDGVPPEARDFAHAVWGAKTIEATAHEAIDRQQLSPEAREAKRVEITNTVKEVIAEADARAEESDMSEAERNEVEESMDHIVEK